MNNKLKSFLYIIIVFVIVSGLYLIYKDINKTELPEEFAFGNGRLETTQVDITTKLSGRLLEINVEEGDIVQKGQILAKLDTNELEAKLKQAKAYVEQAIQEETYAKAIVEQRESELSLAKINYDRTLKLYKNKSLPLINLQNDETTLKTAKAALLAAKAQVVNAQASINAAKAQVETIQVNIDESVLYSPIKGRVLYKIAQTGEVIANGGKVLVVLDLMNTYMTIFLPTAQAGLVDIGSKARIILDAIPDIAIPSYVTFVSPLAQFTPKEIETQSEREKLMFRIKVRIDSSLLEKYFEKIKTGLPGIAYVRLDNSKPWPEELSHLPKNFKE
ncbi:efflux transporter periplasmic adaptor subunit [Halarcobacter mediterraneus]|uniref:Efflux transporter periplasmic adaptor subunit n=1 Tax=Halarcobacter mediterraneus TaxID=2023153 RepID=A0A4V1M183_9BACT|nr:HlyD family efflux transporter periplasmic adaptor subunit [Halarcobacter mediterraneus]RXK12615.1 efflux transporter periplasmic adaptor subunit [Halarcobacter mediterraneus]